DVDGEQLRNQAAPFHCGRIKKRLRSACRKQAERDNYVYHWTSQSDHQFLHWLLRHSLQPRDASNWKQRDVGGVYPKCFRRKRVPKFVQNDASEKQQNKKYAGRRYRRATRRIIPESEPANQQQKGDVNP